jgi:23S rRNA pseudouridine1911/1915/1917 synthase
LNETLHVEDDEINLRLDLYLAERLPNVSRAHIQRLIGIHAVTVNGDPGKPSYRTRLGDQIIFTMPTAKPLETALPEEIPLDVVYEDSDLIVINKAKGMVVHPAPGAETGTLVNALLAHCGSSLSGIGGTLRPGIVHWIKTHRVCWSSRKTTSPIKASHCKYANGPPFASITHSCGAAFPSNML